MATIEDISDALNLSTTSGSYEHIWFHKNARVGGAAAAALVAGRLTSLWEYEGCPSHGAVPGAVAATTNATQGGLLQTDPTGSAQKWLMSATITASVAGTFVLYDRMLQIGGLSGTSTSAQAVGGSLTRYSTTSSPGNRMAVEIYTQIGATPTTATVAYVDQDGNAATSPAFAIGATGLREAQRIIQVPFAAGDTGCRSITSITLAGSTGTAGNFGMMIYRPLMAVSNGVGGVGDTVSLMTTQTPPVEIVADVCLASYWIANATITTAPQIHDSCLYFAEAA